MKKTMQSLKTAVLNGAKARLNCDRYRWSKRAVDPRKVDLVIMYASEMQLTEEAFKQWCLRNWETVYTVVPGNRIDTIKKMVFSITD